jgi:hypothetical protein
MLGVGFGCLILFVWRMSKERQGNGNGPHASC